jgi:hypothetical protein
MSFEKGSDGQAHYRQCSRRNFKRVGEILRALCIDDWQSEQLPTSELCRTSLESLQKEHTMVHEWRNIPQTFGYPGEWIADVMNHTAEKSLQWRPPLEVLTGQTVDISILLCFLFLGRRICYTI